MPCQHLPKLKQRIADLRTKFLESQISAERQDPFTFLPDTDNLAVFRLLVHAEIEEYLETKARDGIKLIEGAFASGNNAVRQNLPLLVISRAIGSNLRFESRYWKDDAKETFKIANDWISKNNGIKEASFNMLAIFSGRMPDELDAGLAASLSTYGSSRGDVAHRSVLRVTSIQGPSDEAKTVEDLITGLEVFFN